MTLAIVVAGVIGVGVAIALAARTAASPFTLVFEGRHELVPVSEKFPNGMRHVGTFTSTAPFCAAGTSTELQVFTSGGSPESATRLFTCDDDSGTLTASVERPPLEHDPPFTSGWRILDGTGRYAGFRGKGTYRGEVVSGNPDDQLSIVFRSKWQGYADPDSVAPTVAVSSAKVSKLRRPAGAYTVRLALTLQDDVEGNVVSYTLRVTGGGFELADRFGTTATGTISVAFRVRPTSSRVRTIRLRVTASDLVGNERSLSRVLKLPR